MSSIIPKIDIASTSTEEVCYEETTKSSSYSANNVEKKKGGRYSRKAKYPRKPSKNKMILPVLWKCP